MKKFTALMSLLCLLLFAGCMVPEEYMLNIDPASAKPLRIAAALPLSGADKQSAERISEGLKFAADRINSGRGINNKPFEFKVFDTGGKVDGAISAARRAADWGACALIAGIDAEEVRAMVPIAVKKRMIVMLPATSDDTLREMSPFVYRVCYSNTQQAEALMAYIYYWRQAKNLVALIDGFEYAAYNRDLAAAVSKAMKQFGGSVINSHLLPKDGAIFENDLVKAIQGLPDVVFVAAVGKRGADIVEKLRSVGYRGIICGPDRWGNSDFYAELPGNGNGETLYTALASERSEFAEYRSFCKEFRQKLYYTPGSYECQSYDAMTFLAQSLYGIRDLEAFDRNWRAIRNHCGAATLYTMKPGGELDRMVYINGVGARVEDDGKTSAVPREVHRLLHSKIKAYSENYFDVR